MITGDSLLIGDAARPDLASEAIEGATGLYGSLQKLLELPDGVELYPGHVAGSLCGAGMSSKASSTIGFERRFNHALERRPGRVRPGARQLVDAAPAEHGEHRRAEPRPVRRRAAAARDDRLAGRRVGARRPARARVRRRARPRRVQRPVRGLLVRDEVRVPADRGRARRHLRVVGRRRPRQPPRACAPSACSSSAATSPTPTRARRSTRSRSTTSRACWPTARSRCSTCARSPSATRATSTARGTCRTGSSAPSPTTSAPSRSPWSRSARPGSRATIAASVLTAAGVEARPVLGGGVEDWAERGGQTVHFRRCGS